MSYRIRTERRPNKIGLDDTIWVVEDESGDGIEIWPALGFNCYRWHDAGPQGKRAEILYFNADMFEKNQTTRIGIPVLFPFPNRIRDGRFTFDGKPYQLYRNDSTKKNAIHGYACRFPWRVVDHGTSATDAWVTGEFHAAQDYGSLPDFPKREDSWPADYRLRLTYRLAKDRLRIEAEVSNPDTKPLPFGLGYHPYLAATYQTADTLVWSPASSYWELVDNLPTGKKLPVSNERDLRRERPIADLNLDDVLSDLGPADGLGLRYVGRIGGPAGKLEMRTSADFRELVVFTPAHRQAFCLEPYTCVTDAVNLQSKMDAGWKVLPPGGVWKGVVQMEVFQAPG